MSVDGSSFFLFSSWMLQYGLDIVIQFQCHSSGTEKRRAVVCSGTNYIPPFYPLKSSDVFRESGTGHRNGTYMYFGTYFCLWDIFNE